MLSLNPRGTERLVIELAARFNDTMPMAVYCLDEAGQWAWELEDRSILVHAIGRLTGFLRAHIVGEGFSENAVGVIYDGIDVGTLPNARLRRRMRDALPAGDEALVVGAIARLDPVKDIATLTRGVAALATDVPAVLANVGDGPERAELKRLAGRLGVEMWVCFIGHRENAREWLAACDVFVNSSASEGVSLTILEAMAAGLPIIATRVGGTPEVLDESSGHLIDARNVEALSNTLKSLAAAQPALHKALGEAARRQAEVCRRSPRRIAGDPRVHVAVDLGSVGLCVVDRGAAGHGYLTTPLP